MKDEIKNSVQNQPDSDCSNDSKKDLTDFWEQPRQSDSFVVSIHIAAHCIEQRKELEKLAWKHLGEGRISAAFHVFYELYKVYVSSVDTPPSVINGIITCYEEWDDPASALLNSKTLIGILKKQGRDDQIPALHERMKRNYQLLSDKARKCENNRDFKSAFYCFSSMLEYGLSLDLEAYLSFLRTGILGGKAQDAYNEISRHPEYMNIIQEHTNLSDMYAKLLECFDDVS